MGHQSSMQETGSFRGKLLAQQSKYCTSLYSSLQARCPRWGAHLGFGITWLEIAISLASGKRLILHGEMHLLVPQPQMFFTLCCSTRWRKEAG
jgi:hypothetical protein